MLPKRDLGTLSHLNVINPHKSDEPRASLELFIMINSERMDYVHATISYAAS